MVELRIQASFKSNNPAGKRCGFWRVIDFDQDQWTKCRWWPWQASVAWQTFCILAGTLVVLKFCKLCWSPRLWKSCLGRDCSDGSWSVSGSAGPNKYLMPTAVPLASSWWHPGLRSYVLAAVVEPNPPASFYLSLSHPTVYQLLRK